MTSSQWFAQSPPLRRSELYVAASEAAYFGREVIARFVESRGGAWVGRR